MRLLRVPVGLALVLLLTSACGARAQPTDLSSGLPLIADNAATASTAASTAPLVQSSLLGIDGTPTGRTIDLPAGFTVTQVAAGLRNPRFMAFDDQGNLLVADMQAGNVYRYPAANGSIAPSAQPPPALVSGLEAPSNVALYGGQLYVGETRAISRFAYDPSGGAVGAREVVVADLPRGGHSTRTVVIRPDGTMYVSVGSSCNICDESDERRAAVLKFAADGSGYERFAYGLRNAVGLAFQPDTGVLWATVNERDNQGNEIPPDMVTSVGQGQHFGWPGCQPPDAKPQGVGRDCSGITPPTVGIQAHSAPLGLAFYTGQQFPAEYANDLFVVQHGSWNREPPAPPKVLRLHFDGGRPVSAQNFATGWQPPDGNRWGRPAGVVVAPDGSLIVSDDQSGALYRITYSA